MADERRLRLRRRLLGLGLLPLLLALALCAKVGVMLAFDDRGRTAFADGQFERAGEAFGVNARLNVFEPWISMFDEGTADHRLADYAGARTLLEQALLVVPDAQQCLVRINLALTIEALGDASLADGRRDDAQAHWREGIAVLDEGACRNTETDTETEPDADADADALANAVAARSVAMRLADKLADRLSETDDEAQDPETTPDPPSLDELERRNEEAQEQRRKNEETREDEPDDEPDEPGEPSEGDAGTPPSYSW